MRTLTSGLTLAALALGSACSSDSPTGPGGGGVLTLGSAVAVSGAADSEKYFTVVVPAGAPALRVTLSGGSGDADIAVRFNARPDGANFACQSSGFDNNEECVIASPTAGTWHILLYGFDAYSGAQLLAEITDAAVTELTLGVPLAVSGSGGGTEREFTVVVPADAPALRVTLSGGSGDADIVLRFNARPDPLNYDCGSFGPATQEECIIANPGAGTWHILLVGFETYGGAQLLAEVTAAPTVTALTSGVALPNQSGAESSLRFFSITVPAGATTLTVTTSGGTGDVDLFVRQGSLPSNGSYDCSSEAAENGESCVVNSPAAGTWYVLLNGYQAYTGVTLTATVTVP